MSKIGRLPVLVPEGVTVDIIDSQVNVKGANGELSFQFRPEVKVKIEKDQVKVLRKEDTKFAKSLHGLTRSIIANMVRGVTEGHQKVLELVGTGYRASLSDEGLVLNVGYSHPVVIAKIPGIHLQIKENKIIVSGADKAVVGEIAAKIRRVRPPEPYKGKGIKYADEIIRRKPGKAVKTVGGGV